MSTFERVKEISKQRGLSLTDTSIKAGLGEKSIYKWKYNEPSALRVQAVADVLNVSVDYLLGNTDDPSPRASDKNDSASKIGGLFRSVADQEGLNEHDRASLQEDAAAYIKMRAELLRKKREGKQ